MLAGLSQNLLAQSVVPLQSTRAVAPDSGQPLLDMAERLIKDGRGAQAYALLQKAERELIGDLRFDYLIGVAALDAGKPDMATLALSRVIAANPKHAGARVDLARAYIALGQKELARGELEGALEFDPPTATRKRIDDLLKDVRPVGKLTGYLAATAGYDDNFNHSTAQNQVYVPFFSSNIDLARDNVKRGAASGAVAAGLRYAYHLDSRAQVFAGLDASRRDLHNVSQFDTNFMGGYVGGGITSGRNDLKLVLQYARTEFGSDPDREIAAIAGEWNYALANGYHFGLGLRHAKVHHSKTGLNVFNHNANTIMANYAGPWSARTNGMIGLFAGVESGSNVNPYGEKQFFGAQIAGEYKLTSALSATAGVSAQRALWDGYNVAFQAVRADTRYDLNAGLNWRFQERWSLQPRYVHNENRSNIPIFTYSRNEVSLTLRHDWQ
jgi:tetratricopeptide (TPR) repeat protein